MSREPISFRVLRAWARSAIAVFYRSVEVTRAAPIPPGRPTIFAANHQSALGDVAVIVAVRPELPHFLAASSWWKRAPARVLFQLGGVVPVYRNTDGRGTRANMSTFAACHAALARGAQLCIFPEGEMHLGEGLLPLKTGAARIALGAVRDAGLHGVVVVPFGLIYEDMGRFRSDVEVRLGTPLEVDAWADADGTDHHAAVRAFTDALYEALADATVAPLGADAVVLDRATAMALSDTDASFAERNKLRRGLRRHHEENVAAVRDAMHEHAFHLHVLALADCDALDAMSPAARRRLDTELAVLTMPAAIGAVASAPMVLAVWVLATRAPDEGWQATVKGVGGTFLLPLGWIGEWALLSKRMSRRRAAAVVAASAVGGWATLAWHDRFRRLRRVRRVEELSRSRPDALRDARKSRDELRAIVQRLVGGDLR
jgi:glycerol-3-phosphate O-acyltransferase/dihydroxyacetone phosphate acyltransferase